MHHLVAGRRSNREIPQGSHSSQQEHHVKCLSYQFLLQIHLFDIDVKGGIRFKESDVLSPGQELVYLTVSGFKIGIGICYDIRFDELARVYRQNGKLMIYSTIDDE